MHQFHIEDMTCKHCEATVTKVIQALDPQAQITINLSKHEAQVSSSLDRQALLNAISDAGFTPQ